MLRISSFKVDNVSENLVTDNLHPVFTWAVESDENGIRITEQKIDIEGYKKEIAGSQSYIYDGPGLIAFSVYRAKISITASTGETASKIISFETGFLNKPRIGKFITDKGYVFKEKKISPKVMVFKKNFTASGRIKKAMLYATAIGMYRVDINGKKAGDMFLTPGFTSYKHDLQYQAVDVTDLLSEENTIVATVSGGWAVGSFVFSRVNRVTADKQSFFAEIRIEYENGDKSVIGTDSTWKVALDGPVTMADIYDGEDYDARITLDKMHFKGAAEESLSISPRISAAVGVPVKEHESFKPISVKKIADELVYDFGQNFAGIVHLDIDGRDGQVVIVKHAEVLHPDGRLNTDFLRSARASIVYTCREGKQSYFPSFTYMGFRYVSVSGIDEDKIKIEARALYSDVADNGDFRCSDEMINRLQENIRWGAKSNFVDIPTDCPQRDERMGWTGDIALFVRTAAYNFDMSRFLAKWLRDMRSEQLSTGGIPNTIPAQGFGFPVTMPTMAIDFWGDASVLVPYAEYMARGDINILTSNYRMMKKYVDACRFWAGLFSFGKKRYLWDTLPALHFGDWVAPDVSRMQQWQRRAKWTATCSLSNTSRLLSEIAGILGKKPDERFYRELSEKAADAYRTYLTDGNGKLKEEFQTAYVLPIYFDMFKGKEKQNAADNLSDLVKKNNYRIGTGFPGTPYILFALADNGHEEEAFKMLTCRECPSWLYEVKQGATTIWERWDGLDENGNCPIGDDGTDTMISYNHYASGAVGDFLYRRVAGIEPIEAGYRRFRIKPLVGGGLTSAQARVGTPYGEIKSDWHITDSRFTIDVKVPVGTECSLILPDGSEHDVTNGKYSFECRL
ncbi:MAG: family 78 glycoside hydrolase catalytic domain [Butyrivibrio sp.]|nr:family 78 glycoside hydrolase catalytic domain [Butyrivibrio sp.]